MDFCLFAILGFHELATLSTPEFRYVSAGLPEPLQNAFDRQAFVIVPRDSPQAREGSGCHSRDVGTASGLDVYVLGLGFAVGPGPSAQTPALSKSRLSRLLAAFLPQFLGFAGALWLLELDWLCEQHATQGHLTPTLLAPSPRCADPIVYRTCAEQGHGCQGARHLVGLSAVSYQAVSYQAVFRKGDEADGPDEGPLTRLVLGWGGAMQRPGQGVLEANGKLLLPGPQGAELRGICCLQSSAFGS